MPEFFFGTDANKVGEVKTSEKTGKLVRVSMFPAAPNKNKLKEGHPGGVSTQWVVAHPTLPLLIALTSYWNKHPAHLTCFKVKDGNLTPVVGCDTAGREACHAMFYPNTNKDKNKVTLACAHLHDGTVTFFQFSTKEMPKSDSFVDQPALTITLPLLQAGIRKTLGTGKGNISIPSSAHVYYAPNGNYLLVVDPTQSCIFTYQVDDTGLPTSEQASATFSCHTDAPALGWFTTLINRFKGYALSSCRPRRVAISPNGQFVYIGYEPRNVVQVYPVNPYGTIDPEQKRGMCMQEVSTIDATLTSKKWIGLTFQAMAEMIVFGQSLYVSNRGSKLIASGMTGMSENSVRVYDIRDGGRLASQHAVTCSGPVRHFCVYEKDGYEILVAGTTKPGMTLETFRRKKAKEGEPSEPYQLVGEAEVGVSIFCVVPCNIKS